MKKKELKKIAEQIAKCELILSNPEAEDWEIKEAKEIILNLTSRVTDMEDMLLIDDYVQNILQKN